MSKETFNRLMGQLCDEAAQQKLEEARAARRRQIVRNIGRALSWVVLAVGLAAGYVYRDEIGRTTARLTSPSENTRAVEAEAKVQKVLKQVQKHMDAAEDAGR